MSDETDAATIANYRRQIERAAQGDKTTVAIEQILATLTRMDDQWREMRAIVQAVACGDMTYDGASSHAVMCVFGCALPGETIHAPDCPVTRARALLAR